MEKDILGEVYYKDTRLITLEFNMLSNNPENVV